MYCAVVVQEVLQRRWDTLKMQRIEAGHWKLTTDKLRAIFEADPCTTTWEAAEELSVNLSKVVQHLKQIWKVKKPSKWVPCELTEKKNRPFEVSSFLILHNNNELFLYQTVTCDEKGIVYVNWLWPAQWLDWEAPKNFPQPNQTCTEQRLRSLFGGLLPIWTTTAFQILEKPLHLQSMFSKSMRCTKN